MTTESLARTTAPAPVTERLGRSWTRLWAAGAISSLGDGAYSAAAPLLAVSFTMNPRLIAGVATAASLPWLFFSLHAGAFADRYDRRRLMWIAQIVQAAAVAFVAIAAALPGGRIWMLYVASFALGTAETVFGNASQSVLPSVVPPSLLEKANGRQYATETVADLFAGPPLGSLLFAASAVLPFWLDAVSFALSALLIMRVRLRADIPVAAPRERQPIRHEILEGLRWLGRHRLLRTLAVLLAVTNLASQLGWSTFVLFARDELHVGARFYGVLLATSAIGGVLGGVLASRMVKALGVRRAIILASGTGAIGTAVVALAAHNAYAMAACLTITSFGAVNWNVATVSMRQRIIPDQLRGRVNSAYRLAAWGAIPIGAALGGVIAGQYGLRAPWYAAAAARLAVFVTAAFVLRAQDFKEEPQPLPSGV